MTLNTDYVMRTGAFEPAEAALGVQTLSTEVAQKKALQRYENLTVSWYTIKLLL